MSSNHKAKQWGAGQGNKVMNCGISAPWRSWAVSGPGMCITKVSVLQNESEAQF